MEDLRPGCGGWKDLQTEDWQRRKRLLHNGSKIFICKCTRQYMVLYHMRKPLKFGQACCRFTCTSVGSTFAVVASFWYLSCGSSTTYLGFQTLCALQVHTFPIAERSGLDDVVWNSHLASCVNSCRKYSAIVYILCFLSLHRETCLPHACRPGLTWLTVGGGNFWLPGSTGLTVSAGEGLFIPWNCVFSGVLQFLHFGRCIFLLE